MRRVLASILSFLERRLDDTVDPTQQQTFLDQFAHLLPESPPAPASAFAIPIVGSDYSFLLTDKTFSPVLKVCGSDPSILSDMMERLLRHIEVRRRGCFQKSVSRREDTWSMRHRAALLLSEYALCVKDLRFLNAALKLNDWAFPRYRRASSRKNLPLYLAALHSQECALRELLS